MEYNGIDVSELQGNIDWQSTAQSDIKFAMIRSSYGSSGVDSQFVNNMSKILKTDILPGVYHQSNAQSIEEAIKEANHFLNTVKSYELYYPLALKIESESAIERGKEFFTSIISAFFNVLKENNYYPIFYTTVNMLSKHIDLDKISEIDIWLADLTLKTPSKPYYQKDVYIWQYSNRGKIPGISGNVNLDISFKNYPEIIKNRGFNNLNTTTSMNDSNSLEPDFSEPIFYKVEKGETLRSIAKKVFGDPEQYKKLMELNGLSRPMVFAGQTLRIPPNNNSNIILYRVKQGDTLWKLSEQFLGYGPRYSEIMSINKLTSDMIYPGQILKIKYDSQSSPSEYIVKEGDTLWKIAQNRLGSGNRYIEIMRLNNLKNGNLRVGQVLNIPSK